MVKYRNYIVHETLSSSHEQTARQISKEYGLSHVTCRLIVNRGIENTDQVKKYLDPSLAELPSPFSLKGMGRAVEIIKDAVLQKIPIVVHGDYDVDGITGTALLVDFLQLLDLEVHYHLPDRLKEGYGLSVDSIDNLKKIVSVPAVLITIDNGIRALEEVHYARELGFKVIVTDHHIPGQKLPEADAIINPKQKGCTFSQTNISGAAVAFFFVMGIRRKMVEQGVWQQISMPNLKKYLDLVALGTVADIMDLTGINRILVKAGLEVLSTRQRDGVKEICNISGLHDSYLRADDIAFKLAPRINACGRLGYPDIAAELLVERNEKKVQKLATKLERANVERKKIENTALEEAMKQADCQVGEGRKGLVVHGEEWHIGIIGIVASRIVHKHGLPVLVLTDDPACKDKLKGSGRSIRAVNIVNILDSCSDMLNKYGGHAMAAGVTLNRNNLLKFSTAFNSSVCKEIQGAVVERIEVDIILRNKVAPKVIASELKIMEPFGAGNKEPVFLIQGAVLEQVTTVKGHLKFYLHIAGQKIQGIGFFMEPLLELTLSPVDLCFTLRESTYRNRKRVELRAKGIFQASDI